MLHTVHLSLGFGRDADGGLNIPGCYNRKLTKWVPHWQPLSTELTAKPLHTKPSHLAGCFCQWNVLRTLQPCCHTLMLLDLRESRDAELRTDCSINRARFMGRFPTSFFRMADFVPNTFWEYEKIVHRTYCDGDLQCLRNYLLKTFLLSPSFCLRC